MTKLLLKKWSIGQFIIRVVSFSHCHLFPQGSEKQGQFLTNLIMLKEQILLFKLLGDTDGLVQINTILTLYFSRFYQLLYLSTLWGSSFSWSIIARICLPNILVHLIEKLESPLAWKKLFRVSHWMFKSSKTSYPDGWWGCMLACLPKYDWLCWNLYWVIFSFKY